MHTTVVVVLRPTQTGSRKITIHVFVVDVTSPVQLDICEPGMRVCERHLHLSQSPDRSPGVNHVSITDIVRHVQSGIRRVTERVHRRHFPLRPERSPETTMYTCECHSVQLGLGDLLYVPVITTHPVRRGAWVLNTTRTVGHHQPPRLT